MCVQSVILSVFTVVTSLALFTLIFCCFKFGDLACG